MKRALGFVAVLAVASTAMAAPMLVDIPVVAGQTGSEGRSITPDGMYVGGNSGSTGFVWSAANGTRQPVAGGYQQAVDGIGYWSDGVTTKLVIEGKNDSSQSLNMSADGGLTWTKVRRTGTTYYGSGLNRVAGTSSGGVVFGTYQTGASVLCMDANNGSGFAAGFPATKSNPGESAINGVSNAGVAVGARKESGGTVFQTVKYWYDGDAGLSWDYLKSPDGAHTGVLYDIADDGSVAGGYGAVAGKTGWYAFINDLSTNTATELPGLGGSNVSTTTNSIVYGVAPNGDYAVGMDYSFGNEKAVLWDLRDMGNITAIDLSAFAAEQGILGSFVNGVAGNALRRGYAVGINGEGNPVVTGYGYSSLNSGWTGYVLTVPEPTSVLFLFIGGLFLVRRR